MDKGPNSTKSRKETEKKWKKKIPNKRRGRFTITGSHISCSTDGLVYHMRSCCPQADTEQISVLLVSFQQEVHAVPSERQWDENDACWRVQEHTTPEYIWPRSSGCCGAQTHLAVACSSTHIQPHNLGVVAVAHQLRVCILNWRTWGFLFTLVLRGVHFLLELRLAVPAQIPGHIHSCPSALCKTSTNRDINSYFSGLAPERDK